MVFPISALTKALKEETKYKVSAKYPKPIQTVDRPSQKEFVINDKLKGVFLFHKILQGLTNLA